MAVREIKTTLTVDNEKEFNKAITEAGRNMRVMASEMKAAAADFNLTGDEMDYLGRRSRSLNQQIEQQEEIIRALEGAVAASAETYGDASAKTDGYRIKLNNAQASLSRLRKELEDCDAEMANLGRDAGRMGRLLEEGIGDAVDAVNTDIESMVGSLEGDLGNIAESVDFSAFKDKIDFAADIISSVSGAITDLADGTAEYRRTMSFLEQNALTAGFDPQIIKDMTFEVSSLTGELEGAVEGMSNLLAAGFEEDELATAIERLSAAVIMFPDTLKFEEMASSLQESIVSGSAVGQYAEYLERMGADLETVNKSFAEAAEKGPEAVETVALAWLTNPNAEAAVTLYKDMNQGLIDAQLAQQKWNDELARTGELLEPVVSMVRRANTILLGKFNDIISDKMTSLGDALHNAWQEDTYEQDMEAFFGDMIDKIGFYKKELENAVKDPAAWLDGLFKDDGKGAQSYFEKGLEKITGMGSMWLDSLFKDEDVDEAVKNSETTGADIAAAIGEGILSKKDEVINQVEEFMRSVEAGLNKVIQGPTIKVNTQSQTDGGAGGRTPQSVNVAIGMDGRTFGSATVPYTSESLGAQIDRYEMYG